MIMSWSFDKVTPIARSVMDCAIIYDVIRGADGKDNSVRASSFSFDSSRDLSGISIGYHTRFFEKELMGNPKEGSYRDHLIKVRKVSKTVLDYFIKRGVNLIPLDFSIDSKGCGIMLEVEASAAFDSYTRNHLNDRKEINSWPRRFRQYRFVSAVDYLKAARYRTLFMEELEEALKEVDVFIEITWSNNWTTNLAGLPVIVLPCGFLYGRPVSITFIGKRDKEEELFAMAHVYQQATSHHLKHPKSFS